MRMKYIILILFVWLCQSCYSPQKENIRNNLNSWINKTVSFSNSLNEFYSKIDSVDTPYSLMYYVDSTICLTCRVDAWNQTISDIEDSVNHPLTSILISSPTSNYLTTAQLKSVTSEKPLFIDENSEFMKLNQLPQSDLLRVILLDKEHKVLAMGNPLINSSMKTLFIKRIREIDAQKVSRNTILTTK